MQSLCTGEWKPSAGEMRQEALQWFRQKLIRSRPGKVAMKRESKREMPETSGWVMYKDAWVRG